MNSILFYYEYLLVTSLMDIMLLNPYSITYWINAVTSLLDVFWLHPYWMSFGYIHIGCFVVTSLSEIFLSCMYILISYLVKYRCIDK